MSNDINELADHRRFIRWLETGKHPAFIKGGGGGPCQLEEKNGTSPLPSLNQRLNQSALAAITLSNALAIKSLPSASSLPLPLNHEPLNADYARLKPLWAQWQSNAHAICNSVYIRGTNIEFWGKLQFDLTEQIKATFPDYAIPNC